jgi:hypothetical protein
MWYPSRTDSRAAIRIDAKDDEDKLLSLSKSSINESTRSRISEEPVRDCFLERLLSPSENISFYLSMIKRRDEHSSWSPAPWKMSRKTGTRRLFRRRSDGFDQHSRAAQRAISHLFDPRKSQKNNLMSTAQAR